MSTNSFKLAAKPERFRKNHPISTYGGYKWRINDRNEIFCTALANPPADVEKPMSSSELLWLVIVNVLGLPGYKEHKQVSWIRRKDYHLLTVGLTTYSSDQRFQAIHLQHSEDWTLKVKFVQKRDGGIYECQVSSHPPTSIFLRLDVVEARAQISGPTEKYLKPGSTLRLQCSVVQTTEAPAFVFWYHNSRMINYDMENGVNVTTDPAQRVSDLLIPATSVAHAGNYTCVPNNAVPASILVHIFNGENPAAMQSSSRSLFSVNIFSFLLPTLSLLNLLR
ncbi:immunoglobulin domain-containing protein [Phthorimaea operculella]|nr:immunoglobulin domain-containing protein [Phthorimaea operculella]